jgi:hypothetical protein
MPQRATNKLDKAANAGRAPRHEHPDDRYDTHPCAVHALLNVERLPHCIWEPACGTGNIVRVLRKAGHHVIATDINRRGCPNSHIADFLSPCQNLTCVSEIRRCRAIVTNPPFVLAQEFITVALQRARLVIMLLRLAFMESVRRAPLLDPGGPLARVHVFANRLPMMHRDGWKGRKASSAIAFAWFVFDRDHSGPATIDRIRWVPA